MRSSLVRRKILRLPINPPPTFIHYNMLMINALLPCETQDFVSPDYPIANLYAL